MEINFQYTISDIKKFYKSHFKNRLEKQIYIVIFLPLLLAFIFTGEPFRLDKFIILTIIFISLHVFILYIIPYLTAVSKIKKSIRKNPDFFKKRKLSITDEGLQVEIENKVDILNWESIIGITDDEEYIVLKLVNENFMLIPKKAFDKNFDAINFIGKIKKKIRSSTNKKDIRKKTDNKPSYYLGLIGLIPIFGAIFGLVLIILGIVKYKDKKFVLIGALGIALSFVIYFPLYQAANNPELTIIVTKKKLKSLVKDIEYFKLINGKYPDSLKQISKKYIIYDPLHFQSEKMQTFGYKKIGDNYILFSTGIDGIPNTDDDIFPEISKNQVGKIGLIRYSIKSEKKN